MITSSPKTQVGARHAMRWLAAFAAVAAVMLVQARPAQAQFVDCPTGQDLLKIPELVSQNGKLRGTIMLSDEQQYIGFRTPGTIAGQGTNKCAPQYVRIFRGVNAVPTAPQPAGSAYPYPVPGPTLRARVGDMIELTFLNQINTANFGDSIDRGERGIGTGCDESTGGPGYPASANDAYPDCFHGSSTGNIHFHGTHTNPNSTGDNVFLEIRPSLRENGKPIVTADSVKDSFEKFFAECESHLKNDVLAEWPKKWSDLPAAWTADQEKLLKKYDSDPTVMEKLWPVDAAQLADGQWPQYYIGAYPYCYHIPAYTDQTWPPASTDHGPAGHGGPATASLQMGQSPGIHWYHAHKHGSTTIDVSNGMTGAFIIEGAYDDELNEYYGANWTRTQPVMVINQLGVTPNLERSGPGRTDKGPDFSVNGRLSPVVTMRPGEVQMWRIVNTSSRAGALFLGPPEGFEWRQLAQDGVQFIDQNYQKALNIQFLMMAGNRVDLLVKAPMTPTTQPVPVLVQNIVDMTDLQAKTPPVKMPLIQVKVAGQPVTGPQSQFIKRAPKFPAFLADISAKEVKGTKTIVFASTSPPNAQHTIDGHKFDGTVGAAVLLNTVEEWKIVNYTANPNISHPFHIHINPFQIVELFDPNEFLTNPTTGQPIINPDTKKPYPKYVLDQDPLTVQGAKQCRLDSGNPESWKPCESQEQAHRIWWDTFPIPSGLLTRGGSQVIPGYFKMRSRFVDYPGLFVMHCHILAHEDRGMMTVVEVTPYKPPILHR